MCTINDNHMCDHICPFNLPPKIKILQKLKKTSGYNIILQMCTKNDNHVMFGYPSNNAKNQNFEKMKKTTGDVIILNMYFINYNHMIYGS